MSTEKRTPHKKSMGLDLTKPLDLSTVKTDDGTCFGKLWDPSKEPCQQCADNDVCCILKEQLVKGKVTQKEEDEGPYLDRATMHELTDNAISRVIKKHKDRLTTDMLVEELMALANIKDRPTVIERIKRYKTTGNIKIKDGVVKWLGE